MDNRAITSIKNGKLGGRPKGSGNKPVIIDSLSEHEIIEIISTAKEQALSGNIYICLNFYSSNTGVAHIKTQTRIYIQIRN